MIFEHAALNVQPDQGEAFEAAFSKAQHNVASMPSYLGHELQRCQEVANNYVLLVRWQTVEDHTVGQRRFSSVLNS